MQASVLDMRLAEVSGREILRESRLSRKEFHNALVMS